MDFYVFGLWGDLDVFVLSITKCDFAFELLLSVCFSCVCHLMCSVFVALKLASFEIKQTTNKKSNNNNNNK